MGKPKPAWWIEVVLGDVVRKRIGPLKSPAAAEKVESGTVIADGERTRLVRESASDSSPRRLVRDQTLRVRVTSDERSQIIADARARKVDISTVVRDALAAYRARKT